MPSWLIDAARGLALAVAKRIVPLVLGALIGLLLDAGLLSGDASRELALKLCEWSSITQDCPVVFRPVPLSMPVGR